jgi:hypothetical protein
MKGFLSGFNSSRAMIVVFVIASFVLGFRAYENQAAVDQARVRLGLGADSIPQQGLNAEVHGTLRKIIHESKRYTRLQSELEGEGVAREGSPQSYIRSIAKHQQIGLGRIEVNTTPPKQIKPGSMDRELRIRPQDAKSSFSRLQACNFMYKLEEGSNRIRVTEFELATADRTEAEEIPNDRWTFDCRVTMREKAGG